MDFNDGKNCVIEKCLRNLYKGLWEVLMFFILDYFGFFFVILLMDVLIY